MRVLTISSACVFTLLSACSNDTNDNPVVASTPKSQTYLSELADTLHNRWQLNDDSIVWQVQDSHQDHIEFSGEQVSAIIYYGSGEQGELLLKRKLVWPMLRTIPNDTHASLIHDFPLAVTPPVELNGVAVKSEQLKRVEINGQLALVSELSDKVSLTRTLSPSTDKPLMVERLRFTNDGNQVAQLALGPLQYSVDTEKAHGVYGSYRIQASSEQQGTYKLAQGASLDIYVSYMATREDEQVNFDGQQELEKRQAYVASLSSKLQLQTPDPIINKMFDFAKLRGAESIFRTKGGLMHGPGGGRYYAAIWANDQAEYINPFFPFLGDNNGNESAINSFNHFARFMNDEGRYIPSSIIAEGDDYWDGAGDRGDCAMIAYGASRFALAYGDVAQAQQLTPLIDWCIAYSFNKQTPQGVIASDSDELEGRFPAGDVNLSTNMLTYGALISSTHLNRELGRIDVANDYRQRAQKLAVDIENYFGANVQGFDTYRYFEGNQKLRAWIALPLTFGVYDRKDETLAALLSDKLWSADGIYSESGNSTFWDRATLYAFRGIFAANETDTAMRYFKYYSRKRLLGEHVPYAVEAWPEGDQRHLSAESGLYARVVTEGIFGIEPVGLKRFTAAPNLPTGWDNMCLNKVQAFNTEFDLCVDRMATDYQVSVSQVGKPKQVYHYKGDNKLTINL
ncbi:hypothetical protein [Shewanella waksmanii]|uniref:hypothetical protein n=1 Tax=Shewanella waksmanii TaxID=213783 RepID=UPI0037350D7F